MFIVGPYVTGEQSIGREKEIGELMRNIKDNVNIPVQGLPRIGKTSLVKETIFRFDQSADVSTPLFFEFTLTRKPENKNQFYMELDDFLKNLINREHRELIDDFKRLKKNFGNTYAFYIKIYKLIYRIQQRTLYIVIDEMDYAHESLRGELQNLRELGNQSDCIRLITISRHSLNSIFPLGNDGSNLPGIFAEPIHLKGYEADDVTLFKRVLTQFYPALNTQIWEKILYYCGNIPILLSIFASRLTADSANLKDIDFSGYIAKDSKYDTCLYYWFQTLCERKLLNQLINFIESQDEGTGDLSTLGLLVNHHLAIPYLKEYILRININSNNDLLNDYCLLNDDIQRLIERTNEIAKDLQGIDDKNYRLLQKSIVELKAIRAKIEFLKTIRDLKSAIIHIDISIEELNLFKEYINKYSADLIAL